MDIDDKIRRGVRIAGWCMLALFLSPFVIALAVRKLPPNAQRSAALALLRQPIPPVRGRDGSDALWLMSYDVPPAEQAQAAARLRQYFADLDRLNREQRQAKAARLPDPRKSMKRFPSFESKGDWVCSESGLDCLAAVRKNLDAAALAVSEHAPGLAAASRVVSEFDGSRSGLPSSFSHDIPTWSSLRALVRTSHALEFAQGRKVEAIGGLCRELAGWRRHGADTNMLFASAIAAAYARQDLQLLSEMLAELPAHVPLPSDCDMALASTRAEELDLCLSFREEFRSVEELFSHDMSAPATPGGKMLIETLVGTRHAAAVAAPVYAAYCGEPMHRTAALDRPAASAHPAEAKCALLEKVGDPIGCWLAEETSDFSSYQDRRTDLAAELALMRTLVWVRAHGTGAQADFDRRPAALGLQRPALVSTDKQEVSIPLFDRRKRDTFALRLAMPASGG